jgi:signal transduction histidine kinase
VGAIRQLLAEYVRADPAIATADPQAAARIKDLAERVDLAYVLPNFDDLIARSREGLKRIQQIVRDLRDFARLDSSDMHPVNLNDGVQSTVNIIRGRAKGKQVAINVHAEELPPVECYPAKINQVIMNLLANAIDACPHGGHVEISTRRRPDAVEIEVADSGSGIDPAVRARIFDPFFTTKPQGEGTGLGLSISYGIVKDHGGTIQVESEKGQGAVFTVRLPLVAPSAAKAVAEPVQRLEPAQTA